MFESIDDMLRELRLDVVESVSVPPRRQARRQIPDAYSTGRLAKVIADESPNKKLWKHQSMALAHLEAGRNLVVATGTASGKSLIFQLHAFYKLLNEPRSKVLVLYPLRALASDQLVSWQRRAKSFGLTRDKVVYISSDLSLSERERIIEKARVVMMTPDLCHAWLIKQIGNSFSNKFVRNLSLVVLDEAHVYESVFGSNFAFLMRRLLTARHRITSGARSDKQLQVVAATATISEPAKHLESLTGLKFRVIEEKSNGAPRQARKIIHLEGPEGGEDGENFLAGLIARICSMEQRHRFIAFMDSRQGVERIAEAVSSESVKPYRSGYEQEDRAEIEAALRTGTLHGVVSTSALELGIDIEDMEIGINLGVPQSRKSFLQRLGRIGRHSPGVFVVVAEPNAFRQFGENLSDYYEASVEPSYLYLGNRFIQFANAQCLRDEMESLDVGPTRAPTGAKWPSGFREILKYARESWPREFEPIAQKGGDAPHFNHPLRQIGETKVTLNLGNMSSPREIGDITHQQALREAFPGGHYLHYLNRFRVTGWKHGFDEIKIFLRQVQKPVPIRPILRKSVTVDLSRDGIVEGRIKRGSSGLIAEIEAQVNESVEGYRIGNKQYLYRDLRAKNPNMKREPRFFRTTGIALKIEEDWFSDRGVRAEVVNGLYDLLCRDKSISPRDIDTEYRNVLIRQASVAQRASDTIVIYDSVYGGIRLTESLFDNIDNYLKQLNRAVEIAGDDAIVSRHILRHLEDWVHSLTSNDAGLSLQAIVPEGWLQVYKPGSLVGLNIFSGIVEREIIRPVYSDPFGLGEKQLNYICKDPSQRVVAGTSEIRSTISHEAAVPSGNDWELVLWNPETDEYQNLEE